MARKIQKGKKSYYNQMVKPNELIREPSSLKIRPPLNLSQILTK